MPVRVLKGYEKTDGTLSYSIVCVISGGERKEKDFLRELIRQKELRSLRVAFVSKEGQGLQPYQMEAIWAAIRQSGEVALANQHYQLDEMDKVFLLSDVDEFYDQLVKISNESDNQEAAQWIVSNPCFEIWLYYCFKNDPETDLESLKSFDAAKRSQEMKHLGNTLVPGGLNPLRAFEQMAEGIAHSREHYAEDEQRIPLLYATQMHEMAQYLIDTMNRTANEYNEFIQRKQAWREKMKRKD
ncbi:RloB family protein [Paraprevotella clara]|uniref:RloB family protein n=1 Tax=Paraprevotella clara TaxID=454154 RepID=UPI003AB64275